MASRPGFFRRLGKNTGRAERWFSYVSSHPVSADRALGFERSAAKGAVHRPTLDAAQWAALKNICRNAPEQRFPF